MTATKSRQSRCFSERHPSQPSQIWWLSPFPTPAQFKYDGANRRIAKVNQYGWADNYYYNQDSQIVEDRYGSDYGGVWSVDQYVWNPGYVDSPLACLHDGNADGDVSSGYPADWRRYYTTDANHNVTTTMRVDNYNDVQDVTRNVYTSYGTVTRMGENWSGSSIEAAFDGPLYCGYFYDADTGLYQVGARYYDSGLSRFNTPDPIQSTPNVYAYCGDGPTNRVDPSGEAWYDYLSAEKNGLNAFLGRQADAVWNWLERGSTTSAAELEQQLLTSQLKSRSFLTAAELHIDLRPRAEQAREAAEREHILSAMDPATLKEIAAAHEARMRHTRLFFSAMPVYSQFNGAYEVLKGRSFVGGERLSGRQQAQSAMFLLLSGVTGEGGSAANGLRTEGEILRESRAAATGATIDEILSGAANQAAQRVGSGSGRVYGTNVHTAFADEVKALGNPNLFTEQSYLNEFPVRYGTAGSIRVDVGVGTLERPTLIYDLKTGGAMLTPLRIQQIQSHLPALSNGLKPAVLEVRP